MKRLISVIITLFIIISALPVLAAALTGDVNGDGQLNNKDVVALFRYVSGSKDAVKDASACDYNGDGEVDNKDVVAMFKAVSGTDPGLVFEELILYPSNEYTHEIDASAYEDEYDLRYLYIMIDRSRNHISPGERFQLRFAVSNPEFRISVKDVALSIESGSQFASLTDDGVFTAKAVGDVKIKAYLKAKPDTVSETTVHITTPQNKETMWKGSGTFRDPYLVSTVKDFLNIQKISKYNGYSDEVDTCWFRQTNDIDFSGVDYEPGCFAHNYDGNGFKLLNITVDETVSNCGSVFGDCRCCVIKNVTVENFTYVRNGYTGVGNTGVFFGTSKHLTAYNCRAVNAVINIEDNGTWNGSAGGFVGHEVEECSYVNCSTDATVNGIFYVGGFIGDSEAFVSMYVNCRATGTASAKIKQSSGFDVYGGFTGNQIPHGPNSDMYELSHQYFDCYSAQYDKMLEVNNIITE